MLAKAQRLNLSQKENQKVFKKQCQYSQNFIFYFEESTQFQVAAVVPKKKVSLASDRNQIRRLIYQAIQELVQEKLEFKIKIIIVLKNKIQIRQLRQEEKKLLKQEIKNQIKNIVKN